MPSTTAHGAQGAGFAGDPGFPPHYGIATCLGVLGPEEPLAGEGAVPPSLGLLRPELREALGDQSASALRPGVRAAQACPACSVQVASMKMFQVQFHTGFVPRNATSVKFAKYVGVT